MAKIWIKKIFDRFNEMGPLAKKFIIILIGGFPDSSVKNPPAMRETWVRYLGWEDPLKKGKATRSSILAWRIPMDREAWRDAVHGLQSRTGLSN